MKTVDKFSISKWMNARDSVNQGAAVLITSVKKARELLIREWIFLHGCGEANEKINVLRGYHYSSPAIRINAQKTDMAGIKLENISYFDFYSCFLRQFKLPARNWD